MRQARTHHHDHQPRWQLTKPISALRAPIRQAVPPRGEASSGAKGARRHCASGVPLLIIATVAVLCLSGGTGMSWLPLLAVGPALAAATSGPWGVLRIGVLAVALGAALGVQGGAPGGEQAVVLSTLSAVTLAGSLASALRRRRERVLAAVRSVAEAAQHAFLKPVPSTVGHFQTAVRYSAAAAEARIGGDLYALVPTPFGVRLIVGDVRGKGLPAVGIAALVLGVFREAAYDEPDLLDVVHRIERSLARNLGPDDFVTAVLAGHPESGRMELVNCGHAAPLLVHDAGVLPVEPVHPAPPLGLRALSGETPSLQDIALSDGDQLLFYTDGVTEARDHKREFYPLVERLSRHISEEPSHTLAALHEDLLAHVGGELHDDAAMLLLRKPAGTASTAPHEPADTASTAPHDPAGRMPSLRVAAG
ncbi:PP2C family protein-serine/threonine phosphatase [Streptomyces decoyicus]|uniref:PP2C family protein-serine/threonine phosphatase n=1 Tax=Streptomyces decoyicus TaxID=249567 RepID=UPI0038690938